MNGRIEHINGIDLYFETYGQGEPLVLLHGFTGSSADWEEIGKSLSKKFQLIIPDLRGHGRSTNDKSTFTFRDVANDIYALLDKLDIVHFKCIGCSGGGNTLLHMATQKPERVKAMVLVSSTMNYPQQARIIMEKASVDNLNEEEWKALRQKHFHGDEQILNLYKYVRGFATDDTDMIFTTKDLSAITASTLIIQGDRDLIYPVEQSVEMYRAISNSELWIVPNAGHGPITKDFPKTVENFLTCTPIVL